MPIKPTLGELPLQKPKTKLVYPELLEEENPPPQNFNWGQKIPTNFYKLKTAPSEKPKPLNEIKITDIEGKYKPLSKYEGLLGNFFVRAPTTYIGVEVELEHVVFKTDLSHTTWNSVEDGSLKEKGLEIVSIPIQYKYIEVELNRLFSCLDKPVTSSRCSIHIHINVRDFTLEELKTFIALYMIFEKSLYNYSGNRWNNNFCVPLFFYPRMVKDFIYFLNYNNIIKYCWYKYSGFNLSPIYGGESKKTGTIEFRHMKGNTDIQNILNWINLIVSLKITAKKHHYEAIEHLLLRMNTTSEYHWLAEETFKTSSTLITSQPTFKQDVEMCIAQTKKVFLKSTPSTLILPIKGL